MIVFLLAASVFLIDYYLKFPEKRILGFSAHLPVNTFAYALLVIVYNKTGFNLNSIIAVVLFMALLALMFFLVSRTEGSTDYSERGPKHKDIWKKRPKSREVEIVRKKEDEGDTVADPFRGVKKKQ